MESPAKESREVDINHTVWRGLKIPPESLHPLDFPVEYWEPPFILTKIDMIRVTVELISAISSDRNRTLGVMEIVNDGTGDKDIGNYTATLKAEYCDGREGKVMAFNRRKQSVWSLIGAFLKLWGHTRHSPKLMSK